MSHTSVTPRRPRGARASSRRSLLVALALSPLLAGCGQILPSGPGPGGTYPPSQQVSGGQASGLRLIGPLSQGVPTTLPAPKLPATATPQAAPAVVKAVANKRFGTILATVGGMTLYELPSQSSSGLGTLSCTGSCARTFLPLLLAPNALWAPGGPGIPPGTLQLVPHPGGGEQIAYQGAPLYTYVGDHSPGQTNGQGHHGGWRVVILPHFRG